MKKFMYWALVWSASVVGMEKPTPSAPPFEPETETEKVFVPNLRPEPSAPPLEELPEIKEPLYRETAKTIEPSVPQEESLPEQPWYQRYWNNAKELAQRSWNWVAMGGTRVVNAIRRLERKINWE